MLSQTVLAEAGRRMTKARLKPNNSRVGIHHNTAILAWGGSHLSGFEKFNARTIPSCYDDHETLH